MLCLLALPLLYLLTALVLGLLPANRDWRAPAAGIPVYLDSNGVHAGLLLPRARARAWTGTMSFRRSIRASGLIWTNSPMSA